jgi:hypothetical protein
MKTVYWIIAVILAAGALVLLIGLGRPPSVSEATSDFCADMSDYAHALLNLRTIDESSTVEDLQNSWAAVADSREAVQESAVTLSEARVEELEATYDELQTTVNSIPDDATLAEAQAQLRLGTLNAVASAVDTLTTTCEISIPQGATTRPQR